jgi:3-oxoadipate enol-lactonase
MITKSVLINGINLAYDDAGSGPAVLLVHGFPLCRKMWHPQVKGLVAAGYRVVAPDLRGFGDSDSSSGPCDMDDYAEDLVELLDHLGIDQAVVVGMSMGGYLLFSLLKNYPARVSGAVFLVTRAVADDDAGKKRRQQLAEDVLKFGPQITADIFQELLFAPQTLQQRPRLAEEVYGWMVETSSQGLAGGLLAMGSRPDSTPLLSQIRIPSLVIAGGLDKACPVALCRQIADGIPEAEFCMFEDAGHMVNLELPNDINSCLLAFLNRVVPTGQNKGSYDCGC